MSVYKYDENTQTMREYDVAYQVQGQDCPEIPNTLDLINTYEKGLKTRIDSSWLPLLKAVDGEIRIGTADGYPNTSIWSAASEIFLESTEVPVTVYGRFPGAEQVYIYNQAQWGILTNRGDYSYQSNTRRVFIRDDQATREVGNDSVPHQTKDLYVGWVPNATACFQAVDAYGGSCKQLVICAKNIRMWYGDWDAAKNQILYHNDDVVFESRSDENYKGTLVPFAKAETEWLDNYFNIEQDGQTIEWYEDTISNEYGKWIRLKKNNTKVAELMYWKDGKIEEEIGKNLTDTAVTKTGSITVGQTTKTYSVTQGPIIRTLKARIYFNPVTEDGKEFNNFCIWPFYLDAGVSYEWFPGFVNSIKKIRYKAASASTWTDAHVYTYTELTQRAKSLGGEISMTEAYTLQITTAGYYDIEWMYDAALLKNTDWPDGNWPHPCLTDAKVYYNYEEHYHETKWREDMDLTDPWIASIDFGNQYVNNVSTNWNDIYLRDWDSNPRMETVSFGPTTVPQNTSLLSGILTRGLKYLVYNNLDNPFGNNIIGIDNWDNKFSDEGTLFYNCSTRQPFNDWWLGVGTGTRIAATIYLHPDVYSLTNHGFDNTVTGWDDGKYNEMINQGIQFLELPSNWRTLVPNYIGE